ncbi:hypothetical protein BJ742DRAFT_872403 [Cladochytrium replicatum]|nr:hypothetical protein BJ742DRAFT_872403 [Cladochytrium replicatum]
MDNGWGWSVSFPIWLPFVIVAVLIYACVQFFGSLKQKILNRRRDALMRTNVTVQNPNPSTDDAAAAADRPVYPPTSASESPSHYEPVAETADSPDSSGKKSFNWFRKLGKNKTINRTTATEV